MWPLDVASFSSTRLVDYFIPSTPIYTLLHIIYSSLIYLCFPSTYTHHLLSLSSSPSLLHTHLPARHLNAPHPPPVSRGDDRRPKFVGEGQRDDGATDQFSGHKFDHSEQLQVAFKAVSNYQLSGSPYLISSLTGRGHTFP